MRRGAAGSAPKTMPAATWTLATGSDAVRLQLETRPRLSWAFPTAASFYLKSSLLPSSRLSLIAPCHPACVLLLFLCSPAHSIEMATGSKPARKGGLRARHNGAAKRSTQEGDEVSAPSGKAAGENGSKEVSKAVALSLVDYSLMLSLVFGGCCSLVESVLLL